MMDSEEVRLIIDEEEQKDLCEQFGIELVQKIAEGSFGVVFKGIDLSDSQPCAVKVTLQNREKYSSIETSILRSLDHPNIVRFKKFCEAHSNKYIVMEFVGGGTLSNLIELRKQEKRAFSEEEVSSILAHLLLGLKSMHENNIIHRDIKPENILLGSHNDFSQLRLSDFGLSVKYQDGVPFRSYSQKCGTVAFMAPEILLDKQYSKPVDIWSCGIILHMLLTLGHHPFKDKAQSREDFIRKIGQIDIAKHTSPLIVNSSDLAKDLLVRMLNKDPSNRYTANQALKHPFITRKLNADIPLNFEENTKLFMNQRKVANVIKSILILKCLQKQQFENQYHNNHYHHHHHLKSSRKGITHVISPKNKLVTSINTSTTTTTTAQTTTASAAANPQPDSFAARVVAAAGASNLSTTIPYQLDGISNNTSLSSPVKIPTFVMNHQPNESQQQNHHHSHLPSSAMTISLSRDHPLDVFSSSSRKKKHQHLHVRSPNSLSAQFYQSMSSDQIISQPGSAQSITVPIVHSSFTGTFSTTLSTKPTTSTSINSSIATAAVVSDHSLPKFYSVSPSGSSNAQRQLPSVVLPTKKLSSHGQRAVRLTQPFVGQQQPQTKQSRPPVPSSQSLQQTQQTNQQLKASSLQRPAHGLVNSATTTVIKRPASISSPTKKVVNDESTHKMSQQQQQQTIIPSSPQFQIKLLQSPKSKQPAGDLTSSRRGVTALKKSTDPDHSSISFGHFRSNTMSHQQQQFHHSHLNSFSSALLDTASLKGQSCSPSSSPIQRHTYSQTAVPQSNTSGKQQKIKDKNSIKLSQFSHQSITKAPVSDDTVATDHYSGSSWFSSPPTMQAIAIPNQKQLQQLIIGYNSYPINAKNSINNNGRKQVTDSIGMNQSIKNRSKNNHSSINNYNHLNNTSSKSKQGKQANNSFHMLDCQETI